MLSRRTLLTTVAPGAALVVAGCTTAQQATITAAYDDFLSQVQSLVAKGCSIGAGFIPAIPSIEAVVNILFPGLGTAVAGVVGAVNTVATALCGATAGQTPASVRKKLSVSSQGTPVTIGTITVGGQAVQVLGYK